MRILVTGVTGYAGFYAAIAFRQAGHKVSGLVRDASKNRAKKLLSYEVNLSEGDLSNPESYRQYLEDSDVIVHTVLDFDSPQETDQKLFATLQQVAKNSRTQRQRLFIYTTGCSIYGKRPERVMDETTPANPEHALAFRMEMESKLFNTAMPNVSKVVLRPGFMYGMDGHSSISAKWFEMAQKGKAVYHGNPEKGWSWVHVNDLARAYVMVAESAANLDNQVFCVADEQRYKCIEIMRACQSAAGYKGEIEIAAPSEDDITSTWFDQNEFITSGKINRWLGWFPKHTGLIDEIETYYNSWKAAQAD
ncbi:MAG: NAD-dependent epimerase/dehydratase family protein [Rivularia sp. (in: Bacteria)]|nr:NAD-dependent epimerase/dehydratase family protein [Rivularia sp. MS3]